MGSLKSVVMQPGNPDMCTSLPVNATFSLCVEGDYFCTETPTPSNSPSCASSPPPGGGGTGSDGTTGGSSFPVAAVAVPVAVVGVVALIAGSLLWRRQRRRASATPCSRA